jgi:hypothetical protein
MILLFHVFFILLDCYEIPYKSRKSSKETNKKLVASFKSKHHIFECSELCFCNKEKCHLSLLNTFNRNSDVWKNFTVWGK